MPARGELAEAERLLEEAIALHGERNPEQVYLAVAYGELGENGVTQLPPKLFRGHAVG